MCASLSKCIDKKNRLFILNESKPTFENCTVYKIYHNILTTVLRKAGRDYYSDQLQINTSDMDKSWKVIKEIRSKRNNENWVVVKLLLKLMVLN